MNLMRLKVQNIDHGHTPDVEKKNEIKQDPDWTLESSRAPRSLRLRSRSARPHRPERPPGRPRWMPSCSWTFSSSSPSLSPYPSPYPSRHPFRSPPSLSSCVCVASCCSSPPPRDRRGGLGVVVVGKRCFEA